MATNDNPQGLTGRKRPRRSRNDYTFAVFCVLDVELHALRAMLDEIHEDLPSDTAFPNTYILGELSGHNVVIAVLPEPGNNRSGIVAARLRQDFPAVEVGLLVGVGGGVPGKDTKNDIRLGDIVVAEPSSSSEAVVQFDKGKHRGNGRFEPTGHLNKPPQSLLSLVKKLKAQHYHAGSRISALVTDILRRYPKMKNDFSYPGSEQDKLFEASYEHDDDNESCQNCRRDRLVRRCARNSQQPQIHYGTIGSSNSVIRDATERDRLREKYGILCVETEAAGLVDELLCLVIRGICDYADSHKNKRWQPYAAVTAAAYAKELLEIIPPSKSNPSNENHSNTSHPADVNIRATIPAQGDVSSVIPDPGFQALQESLKFPRMDLRLHNISQALQKTCQWPITHKEFMAWNDRSKRDSHHGFLWIKGKPGSGKSTLMKALLGWHKKRKRHYDTLTYFFNARAPGSLEKSSLGLYRSLTHQLITTCPSALPLFLEHFCYKIVDNIVEDWTADELEAFLIHAISDHPQRPLVILIDALDEGDEADIRQLVEFLDRLSEAACSSEVWLKICLSSRHYPQITIEHEVSLVMEDEAGHAADIKEYIHRKLRDDESAGMDQLRDEIWYKSAGVFLWIVLVIPMLNKAYDQGDRLDVTTMSRCLSNIPPKLDDLFATILAQSEKDLGDCLTALQWVLFSRKSIGPVELYTAIGVTSSSSKYSGHDTCLKRIGRCLLDTTRGLTEISKSEPPVIQFIHETVRDFLMKRGLVRIDATLSGKIEGVSHDKLKVCCDLYIKQCITNATDNRTSNKAQHDVQKQEMLSKFPLLEYAGSFMLEHANQAQSLGIQQNDWIEELVNTGEGLSKWIHVWNFFEHHKIRRYTLNAPLLYITAEQGLKHLLHLQLDNGVKDCEVAERYSTALEAACAHGFEEIACYLFESKSDVHLEAKTRDQVLHAIIRSESDLEFLVNLLVHNGYKLTADARADYLRRPHLENKLWEVRKLVKLGCSATKLLENFLSRGRLSPGQIPLPTLRFLVDAGADVSAQGGDYHHALETAAKLGDEQRLQLLLDAGIDVNTKCGHYGSALQAAAYYGGKQVVQLLLDAGANINAQGGRYGNALQAAACLGHGQIAKLLLEAGADVNTERGDYGNALQAAAYCGHKQVVQVLLNAGVDVNAQGGRFGNALKAASSAGKIQVVKLLLESGAVTNAKGGEYDSCIEAAVSRGRETTVRYLLDVEVKVHAHIDHYTRALDALASDPLRGDAEASQTMRALLQEAIARSENVEQQDRGLTYDPSDV